jgi:hypothetical protein
LCLHERLLERRESCLSLGLSMRMCVHLLLQMKRMGRHQQHRMWQIVDGQRRGGERGGWRRQG